MMDERELQLPSDAQRREDRELLEALDQHLPVGERYARTGEVPVLPPREPAMRPDPRAAEVHDPTPVQVLARTRRRRGPIVAAVAGTVAALVVVYGLVSLWQVWSVGRSDQVRPVDAIVVMGAAQYDGRPSPQLAARLDHVLALWPRGVAPMVVVTGGKQPTDRFTEADASAAYLTTRGVPADAVVREGEGASTFESWRNVAEIVGDDVRTVLIVTDPYHALRSRLTAEEVGFVAYVSPTTTSVVSGAEELQRDVLEAAGVAVGRVIGFERLSGLTD
jgi:uncharacterized SAM-binding protein YcdF (DUF218 family)